MPKTEQELRARWSPLDPPVVSVSCITYNHEKYIRDAIEGFLTQETAFPFEVIIHDDASTDQTAAIVREYAKRYPSIIRPIYQTENQYSQGNRPIFITLEACRGKYIAFCDGDDYWTDPRKLQKQVQALEARPEAIAVHHDIQIGRGVGPFKRKRMTSRGLVWPQEMDAVALARIDRIPQMSSLLARIAAVREFAPLMRKCPVGDQPLMLLLAQNGLILYLPEVMSVYRWHGRGVDSEQTSRQRTRRHIDTTKGLLALCQDGYLDDRVREVLQERLQDRVARHLSVAVPDTSEFETLARELSPYLSNEDWQAIAWGAARYGEAVKGSIRGSLQYRIGEACFRLAKAISWPVRKLRAGSVS